MAVPLIQGTLRYAYKVDILQGVEKEKAEGAVFAAAVLPRVHACSPEDAETIYNNMKVGASSTSFSAVKTAFENNYECMNIDCATVGGLYNDASGEYYPEAGVCMIEYPMKTPTATPSIYPSQISSFFPTLISTSTTLLTLLLNLHHFHRRILRNMDF